MGFRQIIILLAILPHLVVIGAMLVTARAAFLLRKEYGSSVPVVTVLNAMVGRHDGSPAFLRFARRMRLVWLLIASQVFYLLAIIMLQGLL